MKRIPYKDLQGLIAKLELDEKRSQAQFPFSAIETDAVYEFHNLGPFKKVELSRRLLLPTREPYAFFHTHNVWTTYARTARVVGDFTILSAPEYSRLILCLYEERGHPVIDSLVSRINFGNVRSSTGRALSSASIVCATLTEMHVDDQGYMNQAISVRANGRTEITSTPMVALQSVSDYSGHLLGEKEMDQVTKALSWFTGVHPKNVRLQTPFGQVTAFNAPVQFKLDNSGLDILIIDSDQTIPCIGIGARITYHDGKP